MSYGSKMRRASGIVGCGVLAISLATAAGAQDSSTTTSQAPIPTTDEPPTSTLPIGVPITRVLCPAGHVDATPENTMDDECIPASTTSELPIGVPIFRVICPAGTVDVTPDNPNDDECRVLPAEPRPRQPSFTG